MLYYIVFKYDNVKILGINRLSEPLMLQIVDAVASYVNILEAL